MIDFDKFKTSMLRYKKDSASLKSDETATSPISLGKQDESVFWKYDKEDPNDAASGWVKRSESKANAEMKYILHAKTG